jgi:valyl-tRNA synthetase
VTSAVLRAPAAELALLEKAVDDLRAVGRIAELALANGTDIANTDVIFTEQVD